jgi:hypothetical protein
LILVIAETVGICIYSSQKRERERERERKKRQSVERERGKRENFRYAYCEVSTAALHLLANVLHSKKAL